MTAEIAILNKSAVALAADSAVTITTSQGQKIYNTNKLFMLSKYHPVGIMLYNQADLMRLPWETIIKVYRANLGGAQHETLEEYGSAFTSFLNNSSDLFPESEQDRYFVNTMRRFLNKIKDSIDEETKKIIDDQGDVTEDQVRENVEREIRFYYDTLLTLKFLENMNSEFADTLLEKYSIQIEEAITKVFENLPITAELHEMLRLFSATLFTKVVNDANYSGVVIAGFGKSEPFPSIVSYRIYGMVNNTLRYQIHDRTKIDRDNSAAVHPFAQDEMVQAFMTGIDPTLKDTIAGYITTLFELYPDEILKLFPEMEGERQEQLIAKIKEAGTAFAKEFVDGLDNYSRHNHVFPIIDTVEYLPIDELAAMAESLVNLTSFKRRITMVPETVGGPIDVAVISKGDGFIWIKRKHYFDRDHNPQFLANYYRQ